MNTREKLRRLAELAQDKSAVDLVFLSVNNLCSYTDVIAVCHGRSTRQVQTIAAHIAQEMKRAGERPSIVEGESEGLWVLIDFGDVVFHCFHEPMRLYYDIEGLYPDAQRLDPAAAS
ncbi:MAG TPA: ribosome silencing factor [bacterium]|nr:ribosome silencing factor [bacterium]